MCIAAVDLGAMVGIGTCASRQRTARNGDGVPARGRRRCRRRPGDVGIGHAAIDVAADLTARDRDGILCHSTRVFARIGAFAADDIITDSAVGDCCRIACQSAPARRKGTIDIVCAAARDRNGIRDECGVAGCARAVHLAADIRRARDCDCILLRRANACVGAIARHIGPIDILRRTPADGDRIFRDRRGMGCRRAARTEELAEHTVDGILDIALGDRDRILRSAAHRRVIAANGAALDLPMYHRINGDTQKICTAGDRDAVAFDRCRAVAARNVVDRPLIDGDGVVRNLARTVSGDTVARGQMRRLTAIDLIRHRTVVHDDMVVVHKPRARSGTAEEAADRAGVQRQLVPHGIRTCGGVAAVRLSKARRIVQRKGIVLNDLVFPDRIAAIDRIASAECACMGVVRILVTVELCIDIVARRRGRYIGLRTQPDAVLVVAAPARRTGCCIA